MSRRKKIDPDKFVQFIEVFARRAKIDPASHRGPRARPCHIDWLREFARQCKDAGIAYFVKQLGAHPIIPEVQQPPSQDAIKEQSRIDGEWPAGTHFGNRTGDPKTRELARLVLRDKDLACWCPLDQPCHADVLLEIANKG